MLTANELGRVVERRDARALPALLERVARDEGREALLAVVRALLPGEDRSTVYGMKARRLIGTTAAALHKAGHPEQAARLRQWAPSPTASLLVEGALVSTPDVALAAAVSEGGGGGGAPMGMLDFRRVCERLTEEYLATRGAGAGADDLRARQSQVPHTLARACLRQRMLRIRERAERALSVSLTCASRVRRAWSCAASSWGRWRCCSR